MTEQELAEIEARANAATPGPWSTGRGVEYKDLESVHACGWDFRRVPSANDYYACGPRVPCSLSAEMDATFIAHAREDIPNLLAEVRRLREWKIKNQWQQVEPEDNHDYTVCVAGCVAGFLETYDLKHSIHCPDFTPDGELK